MPVPVGPLRACLVSLVVLVVPLTWWLVVVVYWVAAVWMLGSLSSIDA